MQTGVMSRNCILKLIDSRSNQNLADGRTSVRYMRRRTYRKVKEKEGGARRAVEGMELTGVRWASLKLTRYAEDVF